MSTTPPQHSDHLRFHRQHEHLSKAFGSDLFGLRAEAFARFFGTPLFLGAQTVGVILWIAANMLGLAHFDQYPFILLNLAFSVQAAYAAPLILLAQTRQADRDKAHESSAAHHSEDLANRQEKLLAENTALTEQVKELTEHVDELTKAIHATVVVS